MRTEDLVLATEDRSHVDGTTYPPGSGERQGAVKRKTHAVAFASVCWACKYMMQVHDFLCRISPCHAFIVPIVSDGAIEPTAVDFGTNHPRRLFALTTGAFWHA